MRMGRFLVPLVLLNFVSNSFAQDQSNECNIDEFFDESAGACAPIFGESETLRCGNHLPQCPKNLVCNFDLNPQHGICVFPKCAPQPPRCNPGQTPLEDTFTVCTNNDGSVTFEEGGNCVEKQGCFCIPKFLSKCESVNDCSDDHPEFFVCVENVCKPKDLRCQEDSDCPADVSGDWTCKILSSNRGICIPPNWEDVTSALPEDAYEQYEETDDTKDSETNTSEGKNPFFNCNTTGNGMTLWASLLFGLQAFKRRKKY